MQYQVFVKNPAESEFMASVIGLPNVTANGITEKDAITYGRLRQRQT
jgi:predicted RNase H-like HicB family nuclease